MSLTPPTPTVGVLIMSYGSPTSLGDVERYYTDIRRGRPPEAEQLAELVSRYEAIGGVSHLRTHTDDQVRAITSALATRDPDRYLVTQGTKHSTPTIEDGVAALTSAGVDSLIALVLAPHFSRGSIGTYLSRAEAAAVDADIRFVGIERWWDLPAHLDFQANKIRAVREQALADTGQHAVIAFTAHSLPLRVLEDDPYEQELSDSARAVARRVPIDDNSWFLGWQSAGRSLEPWAGPDIGDTIAAMGSESGKSKAGGQPAPLIVCPHGFVSDHLEVRYDLDVLARRTAHERGLALFRTPVVNDDPDVMGALADLIRSVDR